MELVLASNNAHKLIEVRAVLLGVTVRSSEEYPTVPSSIEETGTTLEENALLKARTVFASTHLPTIADDTGLEVESLGGAPGVYSARYAGEQASFRDNIEKLLRALGEATDRRASFRTVIAFVDKSGEHLFEGACDGVITGSPRGENGFGYDAIFRPEGSTKTFAEMTLEEKNSYSHRARALEKLGEFLLRYKPEKSL